MFELHGNDLDEFNEAIRRIWSLMRDGEWHYASEIEKVAGVPGRPAREGLRRLRELRPMLGQEGLFIECRRIDAFSRDSVYRVMRAVE